MLTNNRFCFDFKFNYQIILLCTSVLLAIYSSNNALAKPLRKYCISKIKPQLVKFNSSNNVSYKPVEQINSYQRPSRTATFFRGESKFIVETDGLDLELRREGETEVIQELRNFVQKDEWISYIFITKDNWLFAHADYNNYMINLNTPEPTLGYGKPKKIPYYGGKCNRLVIWFDGGCPVSSVYHSETLSSAIISGYHATDSGYEWVTVEIVAGEIKVLESPKPIGNVAADLPEFGGAILRTRSNEALFYDGKNINELDLHFEKKRFNDIYPSWIVTIINNYKNHPTNKINQRVYITNVQLGHEIPKFVNEVKIAVQAYTIKNTFPPEIDHRDLGRAFLSFPDDPHKWGTTKNRILFEISGKYRTVVTIPKPYYIPYNLRTVENLRTDLQLHKKNFIFDEPAIAFDVINEKTESSTTYYLKQATPSAQCEVMLDPNNPVELSVD